MIAMCVVDLPLPKCPADWPLPENFRSAYQRWKAKKITDTAAKECEMPLATFRCRAAIYEKTKLL